MSKLDAVTELKKMAANVHKLGLLAPNEPAKAGIEIVRNWIVDLEIRLHTQAKGAVR